MNKQKEREMKAIYKSFEWLLKDKLKQLDWTIRCMFSEMSTFGIKNEMAEPYVKKRFIELIHEVSNEGDVEYAKYQRGRSAKRY